MAEPGLCWKYFEYATVQLEDLSLSVEEIALKNNIATFPIDAQYWNDICVNSETESPAGVWFSISNITVSRTGKFFTSPLF